MHKTGLSIIGLALLSACTAKPTATTPEPLDATPSNAVEAVQAQPAPGHATDAELTLKQIMADPDWMGRFPESPYWADDSQSIYYNQKQPGKQQRDLLHRPLSASGNGDKVALADWYSVDQAGGVWNRDRTQKAYEYRGNIFIKQIEDGRIEAITRSNEPFSDPQFLLNGDLVFQGGYSYYRYDAATGQVQQWVDLRLDDEPEQVKEPDDFIAREQHKLIGYVAGKHRQAKERLAHEQALDAVDPSLANKPWYLGAGQQLVYTSLSPDGDHLLVALRDKIESRRDDDIMPNYIGQDGRIQSVSVRTRVHDHQASTIKLFLLDLARFEKTALPLDALPRISDDIYAAVKQDNQQAYGDDYQAPEAPEQRPLQLMEDWYWSQSAIQWNRDGSTAAIMLEAVDNKTRWLATVDTREPSLNTQHLLHDDAWVNYKFNSFGWLNNSDTLYYLSEESGYAHLYTQQPGQAARQLTSGAFEVDNLTLTRDDKYVYYKANKPHPGIYEIYRVDLETGINEAVTDLGGMNGYLLSPDESKLLLLHSQVTRPPELYVQTAEPGATASPLTNTVSELFQSLPWTAPEVVAVPSSHGEQPVYAKVYYPKDFDPDQSYPAVIFNHGAGYLQNSHLGWSGYFREFMFHSLLTQQGYVVMDMDYRASAGYGRDWRTAIYRHMGKPETEDLVDGVNWLSANAAVNSDKVCTYGGSYGGFMTFMALFTEPELFQCGAALRPVTDWAHYNYPYTSNILNTPQVDPLAYRRSSPLYFAEGLQKPLLINAPMIDDNVFFLDVVRLVQRMIELEKTQHFETAIFPVEPHGFVQPTSWLDEYQRIYQLFEDNLK